MMRPELARAWDELRAHEAAVEAHPESVADLVAIALLLSSPPIVYSGANTLRGVEAWPRAEAAALRALAIDAGVGDAHGVLGSLAHNRDWEFARAEVLLDRALDLGCAPRFATQRVLLLAQQGRDADAMAAVEAVTDATARRYALGAAHYLARRFSDAATAWDQPFWRGLAWCATGDVERAVTILEAGADDAGRNPGYLALLAYAHVLAGDGDAARELERELDDRARAGERIVPYQMATIAVARGEDATALDLLEASLPFRGNWLPWLRRDVRFDPLRSQSRFATIIDAIGMPAEP